MSPAAWQEMTCLPVLLCERCEDVSAPRDFVCKRCREELNFQASLCTQDREIERFLASARAVAW